MFLCVFGSISGFTILIGVSAKQVTPKCRGLKHVSSLNISTGRWFRSSSLCSSDSVPLWLKLRFQPKPQSCEGLRQEDRASSWLTRIAGQGSAGYLGRGRPQFLSSWASPVARCSLDVVLAFLEVVMRRESWKVAFLFITDLTIIQHHLCHLFARTQSLSPTHPKEDGDFERGLSRNLTKYFEATIAPFCSTHI